jgi:hypothetical protein
MKRSTTEIDPHETSNTISFLPNYILLGHIKAPRGSFGADDEVCSTLLEGLPVMDKRLTMLI